MDNGELKKFEISIEIGNFLIWKFRKLISRILSVDDYKMRKDRLELHFFGHVSSIPLFASPFYIRL